MKTERALKLRKQFTEYVSNTFTNAERFYWSCDCIYESLRENIFNTNDYAKCPMWLHAYIDGYIERCFEQHWKLVIFSYEINGKRVTIQSNNYRKIPPNKIDTSTGCYVYIDSPEHFFTLLKD